MTSAIGDPRLIRQVWVNLLSNAVKFSATSEKPAIEVSGRSEEDRTVFTVTDNGVGFDMKHSHKLFGLFQRLHTRKEFDGTGVGLAIVKRIIDRHGGAVWAEAELNGGAAFHFALPNGGGEGHAHDGS